MPSSAPVRFSGPLGWAIAGVAAMALFAAGVLTARAFIDDSAGPSETSAPPDAATALPGVAANRPPLPAFQGNGPSEGKDATASKPAYWGPSGCPATLPAGTFGATGLDFAAVGLTPRVPQTGFELTNISLFANADCAPDGSPIGQPRPVLSTSWRHTATGLDAYLTQLAADEPVAPVLRPDSATFSALGYVFTVSINAYPVRPADASLPYPAGPDPRAGEVLRELIAQLAPDFNQQCFWTVTDGDWGDLAAYGIGDPRPAIPSGFTLQEVHISTFRPPASGCDTSLKPTDGFGLYAYWFAASGSSLGVSISGLPTGVGLKPTPGYIDQSSANWTNGAFQFALWYAPGGDNSAAPDLIREIARALDPTFNDACFVQARTLTDADLRALGFRAPEPPPGYTVSASNLTATDIPAGCTRPEGFVPSYSFWWSLTGGADVIDVSVYAAPGSSSPGSFSGWISDYGLGWVTEDGTSYYLNGYSKGINPRVSRDDLIAVARSLYPALDVAKLVEQKSDGGAVPPRPVPERTN